MDSQIHQIYNVLIVVFGVQGIIMVMLIFSIGASFAAYSRSPDAERSSRGTRVPRPDIDGGPSKPSKADARRAAEEKALNDAIEAAVAKLLQGNGP